MSLEKIVEKVLNDARKEAAEISRESEKKAEEIRAAARKDASELAASLVEEAKRRAELEASRLVTQARLEGRIQLLRQKRELINRIVDEAFTRADIDERILKKEIISKHGTEEELRNRENLLEEIRPGLENYIIEVLKL